MTPPMKITVDAKSGAGYVQYLSTKIEGTIDVWDDGQVAADVDAAGAIVGIEVLDLDSETMAHARMFALKHDLAFPEIDLLGAAG